MAPRLPDMNPDDLYPRMDLPRTLDQVYQAYIQRKQYEAQQGQLAAQKQRQTAEDQLKYGFPAEAVTQPMEGNPWAAQIEAFNQRRTRMQSLEEKKAEREATGAGDTYTPEQTQAILGGKAEELVGAFPGGVPRGAISPAAQASRAQSAETQQAGQSEAELRKELNALSKDYFQVRDSFERIKAVAAKDSAAGDLALIFNYMKMLDPGSTVREGEFATAQNSAGVPERIQAAYNKVISGTRLAKEQRADFVNRAEDLFNSQKNLNSKRAEQYRELAKRKGLKPENVALPEGESEEIKNLVGPDGKTRQARYKGNKFLGWVQ